MAREDRDDVAHLAHLCRVVALEDAVASLLREFNADAAPDERATGISIELDDKGHGDVTYLRGTFPISGEGL